MADGEHSRKMSKGLFCCVAAEGNCGCAENQNYTKNATSKINWASWTFPHWKSDTGMFPKKLEAHHILCVSSVSKIFFNDPEILSIVEATQWCVNKSVNMIAMPMWGHTVKWYCHQAIFGTARTEFTELTAPPFADIPMHNRNHTGNGGYQKEVEEDLKKIVTGVKKQKQPHKVTAEKLQAALDRCAERHDARLRARGKRQGGTHKGWDMGTKGETMWYEPFSMAAEPEKTTFAERNFNDDCAKWIESMKKALGGG